jgi:hypothetical protein
MALPLVLGAIVIIGALIAGVMFAATQDYRGASNDLNQTRAAAAAEMGVNRLTIDWNLSYNTSMKTGDTLRKQYTDPRGAVADVFVTRLAGPFFWVVSEGQTTPGAVQVGARRRYGSLLRLNTPDIPFMAALTGRGTILVGGSSTVSGNDHAPTGWSCPALGKALAGLAMSDTTSGLKLPGCSVSKSCVTGSPQFLQTLAAADTATYFVYGNSTYQALAASASKIIPAGQTLTNLGPVTTSGVCQTTLMTNWGDPNRALPAGACESYFPTIHALGDLHLSGGVGQGILLVDGNLDMTGGFSFTGVLIVRGTVSAYGTGAHVTGGVMAANVDLDADNTVLGNSSINYSSCALQQVMYSSSYPKPAKQRAWINLY